MNVSAKMLSQGSWLRLWKDYDPGCKEISPHPGFRTGNPGLYLIPEYYTGLFDFKSMSLYIAALIPFIHQSMSEAGH